MEAKEGIRSNDNTEMMIRVLAGLAAVLYSLRTFQAAGNIAGYLISLFTAYYKISAVCYLLGSILAFLSCMAMSLALVIFAWRKTKRNTEPLFLLVCVAGVVRTAAVFLRMILTYAGRMTRGSYISGGPFMNFVKEVFYAAVIVGALFAILYASGEMVYVKRSSEELTGMLKELPYSIRKELSNTESRPETPAEPTELRTGRNYIYILVIGLLTGGIYLYYVYYTMTKDLDIICSGDNKSTIGIVPHILLDIATMGFFEFYWQYSVAERMAAISPKYNANIKENGKIILIWQAAGMAVFFLGTYFAMYFQIRNLNRLSEAYNLKMFY